jgi:hypothetical protein
MEGWHRFRGDPMSGTKCILSIVIGLGLLTNIAHGQSVDQLKAELAAKKAEISKLEQRIHALETRSRPESNDKGPSIAAIAAAQRASAPSATPHSALPDDDDTDHALERTLVREGALLLPAYTYELTPQLSAAHWDKMQDPVLRNSYAAAMSFRMGLPWQSQFTFSLPYFHNELANGSSDGLGDAGFLFSKQLFAETDAIPNLIGFVGWTSPTNHGGTFGPIPYVSGFQGGLTTAKRFDPLVVYGTVSYFSAASREISGTQFTPSDVLALRIGASLAITPATSMSAGISGAYLINADAANFIMPNSDRLLSTVDVSFSTIIWRRTLLNLTAQFGLTGHEPEIRLITALPVRF